MNILGYNHILLLIHTMGDNEMIFGAIKNAQDNFPQSRILVWSSNSSLSQGKKLEQYDIDVIYSNSYIGVNRITGFGLLYLEYDYFIASCDDTRFPCDYWEKIISYFDKYSPDIIGENHRSKSAIVPKWVDKSFYGDVPYVIKSKTVDKYGAIIPIAGYYGREQGTEYQQRIIDEGGKALIVYTGAHNLACEGKTYIKEHGFDCLVEEQMKKGQMRVLETHKEWWQK